MTTSAVGSIAYCNPLGYAISFACTGPNCSFLDGIPVATCTEDAGTISCTNGVTCPSDAPTANFSIEQIGTAITLESILDMGDCGSFKITSDGRSAGTTYVTLNPTNENCPVPGASISSVISSSAVPSSTGVLASESLELSIHSSVSSSTTSTSAQSKSLVVTFHIRRCLEGPNAGPFFINTLFHFQVHLKRTDGVRPSGRHHGPSLAEHDLLHGRQR